MHCLDSGSWWEVYACYEVEVDMLKVKFKKHIKTKLDTYQILKTNCKSGPLSIYIYINLFWLRMAYIAKYIVVQGRVWTVSIWRSTSQCLSIISHYSKKKTWTNILILMICTLYLLTHYSFNCFRNLKSVFWLSLKLQMSIKQRQCWQL